MKAKSQAYSFVFTWKSWLLLLLTFLTRFNTGYAQAYTESFNDITTLGGSGWFIQNNSTPVGSINWFQGTATTATPTPGPFNAYAGNANAYIGVNFNSTGSTGTISNWLITPNRTLRNGDVFTFYTRKPTIGGGQTDYPDRLEVRMSTNGASTNVGGNATQLGDFTTLLLSVNPTLVAGGYPQTWTQYTITISGLPAPTSGRIAFRYFVTGAGSLGTSSDYIGIDEVNYTPYVCPTLTVSPSSMPGGKAGEAYSQTMSQTGALGTPSYAITAGALPPGITLSASGTVSGTPTATGTFNFTVTVSDASGCAVSGTLSITVICPSNPISFTAQDICSNAGIIQLNMATPAGGTYSGTGVTGLEFDPAAGTQTVTYDYTDPYGCAYNSNATFTVADVGTSHATPASQSICSGAPITTVVLTNPVPGAIFNWTRDNTVAVTGMAASGTGDITGALVNTTASPVTVTFTITSTVNGCTTDPVTVTVEVKNEALVTAPTTLSQIICSGSNINTIALAGSAGVTAFNWTRDNTTSVTGIAASGSGDISGTLTNTTHAPVSVTFTVTPVAGTCTGTPTDFTITVNPQPAVAVVSVPADGTYSGYGLLSFKVDFTEDVFLTPGGVPSIPVILNTGGTVQANYYSGIGSPSLIFHYTISPTDQDPDGISVGTNLNLNGAIMQSVHGCDIITTLNNIAPATGVKIHNPVAQTITFNGSALQAKTYGDPDFNPGAATSSALTITYTSSDPTVATIAGGQVHIVGAGTTTITASQAGDGDYLSATPVGHTLVVSAKNIAVVTEPKSKVYGSAEPALTYTHLPALIAGDTFTGSLSRVAGENTGVYAISQGTLELSSNYTISYTGDNFTVTEKTITVTAEAKSKVYGSADPAFTYTAFPALIAGDAFAGELGRAAGENAGSYAVTQNTLALNGNYLLNFSPADLVISKAVLIATAGDKTICPEGAVAPVPVSYTGFKNGDNVSSISSEPVVNIPSHTAAGNYPLTPSLGTATNYSFSYVSGQLTVLPAPSGNITQSEVGTGTYELIAPAGVSYAWSRGETTNAISVKASGNYFVTVTNQQGCSSNFNLQVNIQTITIPNTFSPNGDGINDYWTIPELANYPLAYVTVVNRDGQVVFESRNFTRWDGRNAGRELPAGVYFYRVNKTPGAAPVTGWLNLVK